MRPSDLAAAVRVRADLASDAAREAREAAGITAADVARSVGVSRQAVSSWETGAAVPTLEHALAYGKVMRELAKAGAGSPLGRNPGEILPGKAPPDGVIRGQPDSSAARFRRQ